MNELIISVSKIVKIQITQCINSDIGWNTADGLNLKLNKINLPLFNEKWHSKFNQLEHS